MAEETVVDDQVEEVEAVEDAEEIVEVEPVFEDPVISESDEEAEGVIEEPTSAEDGGFRNDQYAMGAALGMTPEQVRAFGDPSSFDQVAGRISQGMQQRQMPVQQGVSPVGNFQFADPESFDEGIVGMNNHANWRFTQMESMLGAMHQQQQRLQAETTGREVDSILNSYSDQIFGRGRLSDIEQESAMNRVAVANEIARQGHGYMSQGQQVPPLEQLVDQAVNTLYGTQMKDQALRSVSEKTRKNASQVTAKPTQQEESPVSGQEAAVRAAAEWHRQNGTFTGQDEFA
jgi:hypothetical protein|tara:strand:- start:1093 stop:1956 length:864 start_codon:yes stop_codon:yes gene_type:complete